MKQENIADEKERKRLDMLNTERVENTRKRIAHAIRLISYPVERLEKNIVSEKCVESFAHAVNLVEAANEEMRWSCEWFGWNDDVCDMLDTSCADFGEAIAFLESGEADDVISAACAAERGRMTLGKAMATLVRWFDDGQDVSEI